MKFVLSKALTLIRRISLLLSMTAIMGATAQASGLDWRFQVLLDGKRIGFHEFTLRDEGGQQILQTEAEFDVKFLFVTAFRYRHQNIEIWNDGCLASIDATTNNNGDRLIVRGDREDGQFTVVSSRGEKELDGCVQTFAYWNPDILDSDRLLNSQTGDYEDIAVELEGEDRIEVADRIVDAKRYRLAAKGGDIKLWYSSSDSVWLALEAPAKGGRTIRYQPVSVPESVDPKLLARND